MWPPPGGSDNIFHFQQGIPINYKPSLATVTGRGHAQYTQLVNSKQYNPGMCDHNWQ